MIWADRNLEHNSFATTSNFKWILIISVYSSEIQKKNEQKSWQHFSNFVYLFSLRKMSWIGPPKISHDPSKSPTWTSLWSRCGLDTISITKTMAPVFSEEVYTLHCFLSYLRSQGHTIVLQWHYKLMWMQKSYVIVLCMANECK